MPYRTSYIDVFEKQTDAMVCELDTADGVIGAAKQFAGWWNDGILMRSADPKAPALTHDELIAVAGRKGIGAYADLDGYDLRVRYVNDRGWVVYPEPHSTLRGGMVAEVVGQEGYENKSNEPNKVMELVWDMCTRAVREEPGKIRRQNLELASKFNETQAERYEAGIERVRKLNAKKQLHDDIMAIEDKALRSKLTLEYPELFSEAEAVAMAEGIRMETYDADVKAWQDSRTAESDAEAGHGYDTVGTSLTEYQSVPESE